MMMVKPYWTGIAGLRLTNIEHYPEEKGAHAEFWHRNLILTDAHGKTEVIDLHGLSEEALMTPEEKQILKDQEDMYAEYCERGIDKDFEEGYVPNGDCEQETAAFNRWLATPSGRKHSSVKPPVTAEQLRKANAPVAF